MKTLSIRRLSGEIIEQASADNELLGITNAGALTAVLLPATPETLKRITQRRHNEIIRSIAAGERELRDKAPLIDLAEALADPVAGSGEHSVTRVSIRQLSGARIEQAGLDGETLAVTNGRAIVALLVPVTADWTKRLVERNLASILDAIDEGERELSTGAVEDLETVLHDSGSAKRPAPADGRSFFIGMGIAPDTAGEAVHVIGVLTDDLTRPVRPPLAMTLRDTDGGTVIRAVEDIVAELQNSEEGSVRVAGIGIELGGHVHKNRIVFAPDAQWDNLALADLLEARLKLPVVLENDANALALRERWIQGIDAETFAVILLTDAGVGCGLVIEGKVRRGVHGMAGEIGHVAVDFAAREKVVCRCGNPGCLEGAATKVAIEAVLAAQKPSLTFEQALSLLSENVSHPARDVFDAAGSALGRAISTVLNLINPSAVIIYGPTSLLGCPGEYRVVSSPPQAGASQIYVDAMLKTIRAHTFSTGADDCRFIVREASAEAGAIAAAAAAVRNR